MKNSDFLAELRGLTLENLIEKISSLREEMLKLRFRAATQPLDVPSELKRVRREIARAETVMNEKVAAKA